METKAFESMTIGIENEREVTGIAASMGVIDAGADMIHKGAFVKTIQERMDRIRHLWQHDMHQPPTAAIIELREVGKAELPKAMKEKFPDVKGGLLVKRRYLETERANEILAGLKSEPPALREMSIGYDPVKWDMEELKSGDMKGMLIRNLREIRLWDTSDVVYGMNEVTDANVKSALPFKDTGVLDEGTDWSAPVLTDFTDEEFDDLADAEKQRISAHFAWTKNNPPQSFDDMKIPHHKPAKNGVGPAIWSGVNLAMKALSGTPAKDRKSVFEHLVKHFEQYKKEAPEYKQVNLIWTIDDLLEQDLDDMPDVFEKLQALAKTLRAEPQPEPVFDPQLVLTQKANLKRAIEIRKRKLALTL